MTQADRLYSRPPLNTPTDTTRRRFLAVAAGASVASVGTLAVAAMPAAEAGIPAADDPIFAAIQAHCEAKAASDAAYAESSRLHRLADEMIGPSKIEIPNMAEPGTTVEAWLHIHVDEAIPHHKFPELNAHYRRLLEARRAIYHDDAREKLTDELADAMWGALDDVAETVPTTLPGLLAMMVYMPPTRTRRSFGTSTRCCSRSRPRPRP